MPIKENYNSKKVYLKRLSFIIILFLVFQIIITYYIQKAQLKLDDLNQMDNNCNLKNSIITVIKKSIRGFEDTAFEECYVINPDDVTYTSDNLKSDLYDVKNNILLYNSINWVVSIFNTISLGLLSAMLLIPSNEIITTL